MNRFKALAVALLLGAVLHGADEPALPDGIRGFRGMVHGTIVSKAERQFVLKIEKIVRLWKKNAAENPQSAVGKEVLVRVREGAQKHLATLRELKVGDRVELEPFHFEGNHLTLVETLKKLPKDD